MIFFCKIRTKISYVWWPVFGPKEGSFSERNFEFKSRDGATVATVGRGAPAQLGEPHFFSDSGYSHSKLLSSNSQKRWKRAANCLSIVIVQDVQACCKTRRMRIMRIFHQHFPALSGLFRCPCNNGQATTRQMRRTESWNAKAAVGCWGKDWSQSKSTANSFVLVENFGWELTWHIQVPSKWVAVIGAKVWSPWLMWQPKLA